MQDSQLIRGTSQTQKILKPQSTKSIVGYNDGEGQRKPVGRPFYA